MAHSILVTGGAGFIGSHLTDHLLAAGHRVTVLDNLVNGRLENLKDAREKGAFTFLEGDILNPDVCREACRGIDVVYHLACLGVRHSLHSPVENHAVNATGSLNVLEAASREGVRAFFYISTSEIYGKATSFPIKESDLPKPTTVYGASKLAGEHYTLTYNENTDMQTTVLRIFNNYGPRSHYEGDAGEIIPRSIVKVLNGQAPVIFGDGQVTRDFFYVRDTAAVLTSLMDNASVIGQTMNIGTGVEITMMDLARKIISACGPAGMTPKMMDDRPADVPRLWVDNSLFRQLVVPTDLMDFEEGLSQTIDYFQNLGPAEDLLSAIEDVNWKKPT